MPTPLLNATSQAAQAARAAQFGANTTAAGDEPSPIVFDRHTPLFSREVDAALIRSVNALRFTDRAPADALPSAPLEFEPTIDSPDWSRAFGAGEVADLTARREAHAERWQALEQRYPYLAAEPLAATPPSEPQPGPAPGPYVSPAAEPLDSRTETLPAEALPTVLPGRPVETTRPRLEGFPVAKPPTSPLVYQERIDVELRPLSAAEQSPSITTRTDAWPKEPLGPRTVVTENIWSENKTRLRNENRIADQLAAAGYQVIQNPRIAPEQLLERGLKAGKQPDYVIEGRVFDLYTPASDTDSSGVGDGIATKISRGQTDRVVVDLSGTDVTRWQLEAELQARPLSRLKEVITLDAQGHIGHAFP